MTARLATAEAEALALSHFGIEGSATELGGERTQNFRIRAFNGSVFTLKVSDPHEDAAVVRFENAALIHLQRTAPAISVPRVVCALDGQDVAPLGPGDVRYLRLLTYLTGLPLSTIGTQSRALRHAIGHAVAALDDALKSFDHPFSRQRDLIWDVRNINRLTPFLSLIDAERRPLAEDALRRFETNAGPLIDRHPAQAVHSDMNGQNILVDENDSERLAGFLDFGDIVHAPRIVDLAGAVLLQIDGTANDLEAALDVARAYHTASPLDDHEIALLPEFMIARCVINVVVTEVLADRNPANRAYIMKNNPVSWKRLKRLSSLSQNPFRDILVP